eukprot:4065300-Amphidinium_carterae.1
MPKTAAARRAQQARAVARRRTAYDQGFGAGIHHIRQEEKEKKEKEKKKAKAADCLGPWDWGG